MRISCPNCSTEYEVPDAALAGRSRKLRCGHCGTQWPAAAPALAFATAPTAGLPVPEPVAAQSPYDAPPAPSAGDGTAAANRFADLVHAARQKQIELEPEDHRPRRPAVASNKRFFALLILLLILSLTLLGHQQITHLLPASARLFQALGLR